jgi:hypothetical protein
MVPAISEPVTAPVVPKVTVPSVAETGSADPRRGSSGRLGCAVPVAAVAAGIIHAELGLPNAVTS